jgi:hypothetical protein
MARSPDRSSTIFNRRSAPCDAHNPLTFSPAKRFALARKAAKIDPLKALREE